MGLPVVSGIVGQENYLHPRGALNHFPANVINNKKEASELYAPGNLIKGLSDGKCEQIVSKIFQSANQTWVKQLLDKGHCIELHAHKEGFPNLDEIIILLKEEQEFLRNSNELIYYDLLSHGFKKGLADSLPDGDSYFNDEIEEQIWRASDHEPLNLGLEEFLDPDFFERNPHLIEVVKSKKTIRKFLEEFKYPPAEEGPNSAPDGKALGAEDEMETSAGKSPPRHSIPPRFVGAKDLKASEETKSDAELLYETLSSICYIPVNCLGSIIWDRIKEEISPRIQTNDVKNYKRFFESFKLRGGMLDLIRPSKIFLYFRKKAISLRMRYMELMTEFSLKELPKEFLEDFVGRTVEVKTKALQVNSLSDDVLEALFKKLESTGFLEDYKKESQAMLTQYDEEVVTYLKSEFLQAFSVELLKKSPFASFLTKIGIKIDENIIEDLQKALEPIFDRLALSSKTFLFDHMEIFKVLNTSLGLASSSQSSSRDKFFQLNWELESDGLRNSLEKQYDKYSEIFNFTMGFNIEIMRVGKASLRSDLKDLGRFFVKTAAALHLIEHDERVSGVTITGPEDDTCAIQNLKGQLIITNFLRRKYKRAKYTVHALELSENTPSSDSSQMIKSVLEKIKPERLSHLTRILESNNLDKIFEAIRNANICAEFCNGSIGYTVGRDAKTPFEEFIHQGLPFVFCTDDRGVGGFEPWKEHLEAFATLKKLHDQNTSRGKDLYLRVYEIFKQSMLQGLHYSFLAGESLLTEQKITVNKKERRIYHVHQLFVRIGESDFTLSDESRKFLMESSKAAAMYEMIVKLKKFEKYAITKFPATIQDEDFEHMIAAEIERVFKDDRKKG